MKTILISDIHSSYRLLSKIYETFRDDKSINSMIFCGDLVDMGEPVSFVDEFLWLIEQLGIKLIWVPGNNDFGRAYHRFNARIKSVEGKITEFNGRKFTGVGGSPASWSGQYEGEKSVDKKAIAGTIFLSHVPPPGIAHYNKFDTPNEKLEAFKHGQIPNDKFQMTNKMSNAENTENLKLDIRNSESPRTLSLTDAPLVHICGHIHHTWGIGHLGATKIVKLAAGYLGYYAIMDLETLDVKFERMK